MEGQPGQGEGQVEGQTRLSEEQVEDERKLLPAMLRCPANDEDAEDEAQLGQEEKRKREVQAMVYRHMMLTTICDVDPDGTRGLKRFDLAPVTSIGSRFIRVDKTVLQYNFKPVVNAIGTPLIKVINRREWGLREMRRRISTYNNPYDFFRPKVIKKLLRSNKGWQLGKSFQTDGVEVRMHLTKVFRGTKPERLTTRDEVNLPDRPFRVVAVDPGRKRYATWWNGQSGERIRTGGGGKVYRPKGDGSMSAEEYYHRCGFLKAARKRRRWRAGRLPSLRDAETHPARSLKIAPSYGDTQHPYIVLQLADNFTEAVSNQPNADASQDHWRMVKEAMRRRLSTLDDEFRFYCRPRWLRLKFHVRMKKQRLLDEFVNEICPGQDCIVVWGNALFPHNSRGNVSGAAGVLFDHLCRKKRSQVQVYDEFRTSRMCYNCGAPNQSVTSNSEGVFASRMHEITQGRIRGGFRINYHGILQCRRCRTTWGRDANAARNMHTSFLSERLRDENGRRLRHIARPQRAQGNASDAGNE